MKQLIGHTSAETAFTVSDYPYGFRLRTQIRYWVESKAGFGQRFVSQTLNPKSDKWNKPKAGTYLNIVVMGLDEDTGYVTHDGLSHWGDEISIKAFSDKYTLDAFQLKQVRTLIAAARVGEKVTWKINSGEPTQTREEQAAIFNRAMNHELRAM